MMENDLISRSALVKVLEKIRTALDQRDDGLAAKIMQIHIQFIEGIPAVDAVEVTRCLECKWYSHYGRTSLLVDGKNVKAGWCQRRIRYDEEYRMLPDDFCSYGERKADDGK